MKLGSYDGPGFHSCALFSWKTTSKIYKDACFCKGSYLKKKQNKTKKHTLIGNLDDSQSLKTILPLLSQDLWLQGPSGPITSLSNYGFCGYFCLFVYKNYSLPLPVPRLPTYFPFQPKTEHPQFVNLENKAVLLLQDIPDFSLGVISIKDDWQLTMSRPGSSLFLTPS